jgi:hydroxyquinol 1,2-dioxygenase
MLVDAINHPVPEGATETTVLGPFFVQAAPEKQRKSFDHQGKPSTLRDLVDSRSGVAPWRW